jgi:iron complex outermembrane receptor protein
MSARLHTTSAIALVAIATSSTAFAQVQGSPVNTAPPAEAQSATPTAAGQETGPASEIIVTAQRRSETLERTPVAVSVVSAQSLAERAITTETDLQSAVPGLTVKTGQNENQLNFSLRGQSVDPFSSSRPSVLPYFNEVQVGGVGGTALYDLSSVQVLKGPQGTLFGRNSTGGAVLYSSQKPREEFGGYVTGRVGNYSAFQLEGAVNVPLVADTALLRVAGQIQRRDGFQQNLFRNERLGEIRRENVRVSLTLKPAADLSNELVVDYGHSNGNSLTSVVYNVLPLGAPAFVPFNFLFSPAVDSVFGPGTWAAYLAAHPKADPEGLIAFAAKQKARGPYVVNVDSPNYYQQKKLIVSNVTALKLGDQATIKNIVGYVRSRFRGAGEFDGSPFGGDANGPDGRGGLIEQFSNELQILGKIGGRLDYVAGGYYSHETDQTRSTSVIFDLAPVSPPVVQINDGKFANDTYAGYAQGTFDLGLGGLKLTAGGRYSIEKTQFVRAADDTYVTNPLPAYDFNQRATFKKFSWTVGVEDQVSSSVLLYAKSRRSFRSGGFNYFAPPTVGLGNASGGAYRPEVATDVELGAKYRGDLGAVPVRLNLAGYTMWVKDIQRAFYAQIFGNLAAITVNVPRAKISGVELDGSVEPATWLTLGGSANYTNARFTSNVVNVVGNPQARFDTYPDTPEWSGAAYINVKAPMTDTLNANFRADVYAQTFTYFSSTAKSLTPGAQIPGYALVNLRAGFGDKDGRWSLAVVGKNVFDKVYYTGGVGFANIFSLNTAVPGDRRTVMAEARFTF